jgi:hypothetical protein
MEQDDKASKTAEVEESQLHKHSKVITGLRTLDDTLHWRYNTRNLYPDEDESIEVRFFILMKDTPAPQKDDAVKTLLKQMEDTEVPWLVPRRGAWAFSLDGMKEEFKDLQRLDWCRGRVFVEPEFEVKREVNGISKTKYYETYVIFYINPEVLGMATRHIVPVEIQQSLNEFRLDHPDPNKVAFVMMKYEGTVAHDNIVRGINDTLASHGLTAVRADHKEYHSDLYYNILTYIYGCGFGIAVFERIVENEFNPNVSLEVGYTLALGKQVCLLKDKTLPKLHTDLVGKLYRVFDPQDPVGSIPPVLTKWMQEKRII